MNQGYGFFQDSRGNYSSTRLNSTIVIWAGILLAIFLIIFKNDVGGAVSVVAAFTSLAVAAKTLGKAQENQEYKSQPPIIHEEEIVK